MTVFEHIWQAAIFGTDLRSAILIGRFAEAAWTFVPDVFKKSKTVGRILPSKTYILHGCLPSRDRCGFGMKSQFRAKSRLISIRKMRTDCRNGMQA